MVFFLLYFLIATQDIVVDGWSVLLFNNSNPQWASTCQLIGQMSGTFIGSTILMTFESSNFTNKYIRQPLSLPYRSYGLFTLQQFTVFWGIAFIIVGIILIIIPFFKRQSKEKNNNNIQKTKEIKLNLLETYLAVLKLFKKRCIRELALIPLTFYLGFGATAHMTNLTLSEYGVTRDTLALMNIPLFVIHLIIPICLSGTRRPLIWFARGYIPRLIASLILAIYIYFTPRILHTFYFYPILTALFCLNEVFVYLMIVSYVGFYAKISELHITATCITLLVTISNLGKSLSSTLVLYIANWLPKSDAYSIEVGACIILGFIWIGLTWRTIKHLSALPVEEWYLNSSLSKPSSITSSQPTIIEGGDFLAAAITVLIQFGYGFSLVAYGYNHVNPVTSILAVCKIQTYIQQSTAMMQRWFMIVATFDRYACTSSRADLRRFATVRVARRVVLCIVVIWLVIAVFPAVFFTIKAGACNIFDNDLAALIRSIYVAIAGAILPLLILIPSLVLLQRNLAHKRQRHHHIVVQPRKGRNKAQEFERKRDQQVLAILLIQVLAYIILVIPLMIIQIYNAITLSISNKSIDRIIIEQIVFSLTDLLATIYPSLSFYLNTITSRMFRDELMIIVRSILSCRWLLSTNRIEPFTNHITIQVPNMVPNGKILESAIEASPRQLNMEQRMAQ